MSMSLLFYNIMLEVLISTIKKEKEIRGIYHKWRNKTVLTCSWHGCLHRKSQGTYKTKNPKTRTNKFINFKIQINIQKSNVLLCISNEHVDNKIKYTILFTITQKMKCLGVNWTFKGFVCWKLQNAAERYQRSK